jgi:hypothetical protein
MRASQPQVNTTLNLFGWIFVSGKLALQKVAFYSLSAWLVS